VISPFNSYQNNQVITSSPEKILLMLYDGAINFSKMAIDLLQREDLAGKGKYIGKAQAIVTELMNTLNHEVGKDIAQRLEQLYLYLIDEFTQANVHNSVQSLQNAVKVLTILRDAWAEAVVIARKDRYVGQPQDVFVRAAG